MACMNRRVVRPSRHCHHRTEYFDPAGEPCFAYREQLPLMAPAPRPKTPIAVRLFKATLNEPHPPIRVVPWISLTQRFDHSGAFPASKRPHGMAHVTSSWKECISAGNSPLVTASRAPCDD